MPPQTFQFKAYTPTGGYLVSKHIRTDDYARILQCLIDMSKLNVKSYYVKHGTRSKKVTKTPDEQIKNLQNILFKPSPKQPL
jgi:hypothetical protein